MSNPPTQPPPQGGRSVNRGSRNPNPELDVEGFSLLHVLGVFGLALVFFALGYWLISRQFDTVPRLLAAGGILLIGLFFWFNPATLGGLFSSRGARNSGNAFVLIAALIGIVIVLNLLAGRYLTARADLTSTGQYSLSEQTRSLLGQFKEDINATAYLSQGNANRDAARNILESYRAASSRFNFEVVDVEVDPVRSRNSGLNGDGIVLETKLGGETIKDAITEQPDEANITAGLIRLLDPTPASVYFLSGHLEHELTDSGPFGYSTLAAALKQEGYLVESVNLDSVQAITNTGLSVLVVAGPQTGFSVTDTRKINDFNRKGGRLLIMQDSPFIMRDGQATISSTNALLAPYGVSFANGLLLDDDPLALIQGESPGIFRAFDYTFAAITRAFKAQGSTLVNIVSFPTALLTNQPVVTGTGVVKSPLLQTTERGYVKTQLPQQNDSTDLSNKGEQRGKFILGVAIEQPATTTYSATRVVALGNSQTVSNAVLQQYSGLTYNRDLVLNSINWLVQKDTLSGIRTQDEDFRRLSLNQVSSSLIFYVSALLLPGLVLLFGGLIWWRRR